MTREDVINNLISTYSRHGVTKFLIETEIESGLKEGFSYQTIYTGLRMAMGNYFNEEEYFTPAEMAEALGVTEDEMINQIKEMEKELIEKGEDTSQYFKKTEPIQTQRFIILPGGLK